MTTNPMTTKPMTTNPMTTNPMTTKPMTTKPMTTKPMTTKPMTTNPINNLNVSSNLMNNGYKIPQTNLYQQNFNGTSNVYSPYLHVTETFQPMTYDIDKYQNI
jgi:hypothetical protein